MTEHERTIRPALAAIVLVCFFMPFLKVSCGGQTFMAISGFDLATGNEVKPEGKFMEMAQSGGFQPGGNIGQSQPYQSDPNNPGMPDSLWQQTPMGQIDQSPQFGQMEGMNGEAKFEPVAAAAMVMATLALLFALPASRRNKILSAVTAGLCAILLLVLKTRAGADLPPEASMIISIQWTAQYWIAVVGSGLLALFTFQVLSRKDTDRERPRLVIQTYEKPEHSEKFVS